MSVPASDLLSGAAPRPSNWLAAGAVAEAVRARAT